MAKITKNENKKLELVPASGLASMTQLFTPSDVSELPKNAKKLTLPPLVKPDQMPVGTILSAVIVGIAPSISPREDMRGSKLIHLRHDSGTEFLFPLTGTIKKALGGEKGIVENYIGKRLVIQRQADGETRKYCAPGEPAKKVFMFDIYLAD
jgi:hypothetical protein